MTAPPRSELHPSPWGDHYAPEFVVSIDGKPLSPATHGDVLEVSVVLDEQDPGAFTLTINDWDDVAIAPKYSSTTTFDPGTRVTIDLGYAGRLERVLTGSVKSLSPRFPESGSPTLSVGGQDLMRDMADRQPGDGERKIYRDRTDAEIAKEIAARWGMTTDVTASAPRHRLVTQRQDDAAFLRERARRIDYEFYIALADTSGEEIFTFVPRRDGRDGRALEVYRFEWGRSLISFMPRLSTNGQVGAVTVRGWDPRTKSPIVYTARPEDLPSSAASGRRSGAGAAGSRATEVLYEASVLSLEEARHLAVGRLMERTNQYLQGSGRSVGLPDLRPGATVEIAGVGSRFEGRYHVTKVTHTVSASGFTTAFDVDRAVEGQAGGRPRPRRSR